MINFVPFFKRKDFNDGVDEPQEVEHFNSFGEGYDYFLWRNPEAIKGELNI